MASGNTPDADKTKREQERAARALELAREAAQLRKQATTPDQIKAAEQKLYEIERLFVPEGERGPLIITVPDAINPRLDLFKENPHLAGLPEAHERIIETVDFGALLAEGKKLYAELGLPEWARALPDTLSFTNEQQELFRELIKAGNVPLFLPDADTQRKTIDKAIQVLKPVWIKEGAVQEIKATAHNWDHFKNLTKNKNNSLFIGVPDRPYISFTKPTRITMEETRNKTVAEQQALFQLWKQTNPQLWLMNAIPWLVMQAVETRREHAYAQKKNLALTALTPFDDGTKSWTRFLDLPTAGGNIPYGVFWPVDASLGLGRSLADGPYPEGGFRLEVRVEI